MEDAGFCGKPFTGQRMGRKVSASTRETEGNIGIYVHRVAPAAARITQTMERGGTCPIYTSKPSLNCYSGGRVMIIATALISVAWKYCIMCCSNRMFDGSGKCPKHNPPAERSTKLRRRTVCGRRTEALPRDRSESVPFYVDSRRSLYPETAVTCATDAPFSPGTILPLGKRVG